MDPRFDTKDLGAASRSPLLPKLPLSAKFFEDVVHEPKPIENLGGL
jgi:hypothetical protein